MGIFFCVVGIDLWKSQVLSCIWAANSFICSMDSSFCTTWWPSSLVMSCYSELCLYITYFKKVLPCPGAFVNTLLFSFFACDLRSSIWEFDLVRLFAFWAFLEYNSIPVLISYHMQEPKWLSASITLLSPVMTVSSCKQHQVLVLCSFAGETR